MGCLRLYAEFDNFRKRTMREKAELIGSASSDIMFQLLPLVDDFDRAQENGPDDVAALKEGMELIHSKFVATLISKGLEVMETKPVTIWMSISTRQLQIYPLQQKI